jgi:hypothetical protein
VSTEDPRLTRAWEEQSKLRSALSELLDAIESLEGYELTRDVDHYKSQAIWDDAIRRAQDLL